MKRSLVSVIIPVYNSATFLADAIKSIQNQTLNDLELILIDDKSTDNSLSIIRSFAETDMRIKVLKNKNNLGAYASRNRGIEVATGDFIAGLDADDIALPDRLRTQWEFMQENTEIGISGSWMEILGQNGLVWKYPETDMAIRCRMLFSNPIACPTFFIRREILEQNGLRFSPQNRIAEDYLFWAKLVNHTKAANIQKPLVQYRLHPDQISSKNKKEQLEASLKLHRELLSKLGINCTEFELSIHEMLVNFEITQTEDILGLIEKWILKLLYANKIFKQYAPENFEEELMSRWTSTCTNIKMEANNCIKIIKSPLKINGKYSYSRLLFIFSRIYHSIVDRIDKTFSCVTRANLR